MPDIAIKATLVVNVLSMSTLRGQACLVALIFVSENQRHKLNTHVFLKTSPLPTAELQSFYVLKMPDITRYQFSLVGKRDRSNHRVNLAGRLAYLP